MKSILSGILIGIGGTIYLSVENKIVGSILFSIGLLSICYLKLPLYTGKIGYLIKKEISIYDLFYILMGNILGALITGLVIGYSKSNIYELALNLINNKHQINYLIVLINSIFCGILMYIAVNTFKENKSIIGILFAVPVFILSGFEHSIAYCFYAGAARNIDLLFLLVAAVGNSLGGFLIPLVERSQLN